jgi:uncharacterized protein (DUF58 family)
MSLTKELIKVNNLQLAAKLVSDQLLMGMHASKRSGIGAEFEQYRHYIPGDDPSRIDWKLFARTQKHQIRESSTESIHCINFILDLSGSMNYAENEVSRLDYAKIILASLSYLGFRQSDNMNLYFLKDGQLKRVVTEGKQSFQKILYQLENAKAIGNWTFEKVNFLDFQTKVKELLIFASDLFQSDSEFFSLIKTWERPNKEILIFQILGEKEIDLNLEGTIKFKDLETGKTKELSPTSIRKNYETNFNSFLKEIDDELNLKNVHLYRCKLTDPISEVLKNALKKLKWS